MRERTTNKPRLHGEILGHIFSKIGPTVYPSSDPLRIEHQFMRAGNELGCAVRLKKAGRSYKMAVSASDVLRFVQLAEAGISYIGDINQQTSRSIETTLLVEAECLKLAKSLT
jgi:hypothetical protein